MGAPRRFSRVMETTTSTGSGPFTLAGAVIGYQTFACVGNAKSCIYTITDGTNWMEVLGTYTSSGTSLSVDTVLQSSNGGSAVTFSAGTKQVFLSESPLFVPRYGYQTTILENIFAGQATTTFTNGQTYTIGGVTHTANLSNSGSAASIVASGLQLTGPTSGEMFFNSAAGSVRTALGEGDNTLAEARFRRGMWAYWWRIASISLVQTQYFYSGIVAAYPYQGYHMMRGRGAANMQATSTGGIAAGFWWGNADSVSMTQNVAYDTFCLLFRSPYDVEYFAGNWSSGWPSLESMEPQAIARPLGNTGSAGLMVRGNSSSPPRPLSEFWIQFACNASISVVVDRYRFTVWE